MDNLGSDSGQVDFAGGEEVFDSGKGGALFPERPVSYFSLYLKGMAMGGADVVPGVSGGAIAMVCGVYLQLVESIRTLGSKRFFELFRRGGLRRFLLAVRFDFLLFLGLGILTSILLLAGLIVYLMEAYPVLVWSFFLGLILASVWYVGRGVGRWSWVSVTMLVIGVGVGLMIGLLTPGSLPEGGVWYFVSGAIAICAMILPGISGSFVLLLLGKYESVMQAVGVFDWAVLMPFALGALVGILSFSHLLSWLLHRYYDPTVALLTGFMLGSVVRLWPWQREVESGFELLSPSSYSDLTGEPSYVVWSLILVIIGTCVVILLENFSSRRCTAEGVSGAHRG